MAFVTHSALVRAQSAAELRDQELKIRRVAGMQGPGRVIIVQSESCGDFVVATNASGQSFGAGAAVLTGRIGLSTSELVISRPPPGAGSTVAPRTTTINQGPGPAVREYRSLVQDPTDSDKLHILQYFEGVFSKVVNTIDFADGRNIGSSLDAATPIKGVAGVADGLAFPLSGPGGQFTYRVVNEVSGTFVEAATTTGVTGSHVSGTLYIDGLSLFVGGVVDFNAAPDEYKLLRMTLPSISDLTELAALPLAGGSVYRFPGVWMTDRHRLPESAAGSWIGIDDSLFSASTSITSDIINLDSASQIWPLGHDGADGYFIWVNGGVFKFGKIATSGSGADLGFSADWEDDFVQNVIFSGAWPNRFVTVVGVKSPAQAAAGAEPRAATLAFTGSPSTLPVPFTIELAAAEAALGIGAGEAYPFAFLPWFP